MNRPTALFTIAAVLLLLGLVGTYDLAASEAEHATYCDMVSMGHWPAYKGECK